MKLEKLYRKGQIEIRTLLNQLGFRKKKVFAIGFNKSASTSLHNLFKSFGLPSYHGTLWRSHDDLNFIKKYDCFSDDIPRNLEELDARYPGSKFILNIRDLRGWLYSRLAHIERKKGSPGYETTSTWDCTEEAVTRWIKRRNEYHLFVLSYFRDRPKDLLIVNFIRDESAATKIANFLGFKGEVLRPKKNVNPNKTHSPEHSRIINESVKHLGIPDNELDYDLYCPSLEDEATVSQYPFDSDHLNKFDTKG